MNLMPMSHVTSPLRVVIVGGGLSGASLAWHLAQMQVPVVVTVIEPRAELGRGLAYSTTEPTHRINVPAHRMSLDPDHHDDFADWLREAAASGRLPPDDQADAGRGDLFPRREVFGQYVADRLAPHLQAGAVRHLRARVQDIQRNEDGSLLLHLSDDGLVRADLLVLATGHPPPAVPA